MKDYDKNKESSHLKHWDANNLYLWAMSQKLPANNYEWIEYISKFDKHFIKTIMKNDLLMIYYFYL